MTLHVTAGPRYAFLREQLQERLDPPASIVELGAAPGDQIAAIADQGYQATAVDIGISSDGWADGTEGRMVRLFRDHGVKYVEWNLEETPYPLASEAFDGVLYTEVFEHLRDYPVRSLQECARILKPGGYLFFSTPNSAYIMNRLRLLGGKSVYTPLDDWIAGVPHARHSREYLFPEVERVMKIAGLNVVFQASRHFHVEDQSRARRLVKLGLDRVARAKMEFGPSILMVAQKAA
jgi:2-polyprenyl-3-methyl-5-hydroxy-6-metoxy-1,4-benzoquinol methylase